MKLPVLVLNALLVATATPFAQEAATPGEVRRVKVLQDAEPGAATKSTIAADGKVSLRFVNSDVKELVTFYAELVGQAPVLDNQCVGPASVVTREPVPREQATALLEQTLFANGFSLVDLDARTLVVNGIGKSPRSTPLPILEKIEDLPQRERVVVFMFRLQHRSAQEIAQFLGTFVVQSPGQYTNITPDAKAGLVFVTERSSMIRKLAAVIRALDVAESGGK